jgi:hypothetical protein
LLISALFAIEQTYHCLCWWYSQHCARSSTNVIAALQFMFVKTNATTRLCASLYSIDCSHESQPIHYCVSTHWAFSMVVVALVFGSIRLHDSRLGLFGPVSLKHSQHSHRDWSLGGASFLGCVSASWNPLHIPPSTLLQSGSFTVIVASSSCQPFAKRRPEQYWFRCRLWFVS